MIYARPMLAYLFPGLLAGFYGGHGWRAFAASASRGIGRGKKQAAITNKEN